MIKMKKINLKKSMINIFIVTIVLLVIGFIIISVKYYSLKTKGNSFNIEFTKVKMTSSIKGSKKEPSGKLEIISNSKELDMNFNLYSEKDELKYDITIKNTGDVNAEIVDLLMSPDYIKEDKSLISPISMKLTDVSGKILEPGEEITVKLDVVYNAGTIKDSKNIKGKIGIIATS